MGPLPLPVRERAQGTVGQLCDPGLAHGVERDLLVGRGAVRFEGDEFAAEGTHEDLLERSADHRSLLAQAERTEVAAAS